MIQKLPIISSNDVPKGTGLRLLRDFACTPMKREASWLYAMMSTPRAFRAVGMAFQPRRESQ